MKEDPDFIEHHKVDLAASLEATVVDILMDKLRKAAKEYKIKEVAVAGGDCVMLSGNMRKSMAGISLYLNSAIPLTTRL